jgi:4'-phosphopantetheinyl transferase EntD
VENLFEGLLPSAVRVAASPVYDCVSALLPGERPFIERAVESRRQEFATGRVLARGLLDGLGYPDFELLREEDRTPGWPAQVVGSITHSKAFCVVAVGRATEFRGVGIDLEPDKSTDSDIERVVCRGPEHDWVASAGEADRGRRCRIVFSVKEAVYKAFYPRTRTFWSFQDVGVSIDLEAGSYLAELPEGTGLAKVTGRVACRSGWIVSAVAVEAE